ncbi:MAG: hypothetical protein HY662_01840, partial [Chloroflexi bacterium]|nr:hypothetical protein [Chloroflexota bacterium]
GLFMPTASIAADWLAATGADKAAALSVATALFHVGGVTFTMFILVDWLAIFFLGIGMARSAVYPKWLGWAGLILGILMVAIVGIPQFFAGQTSMTQTLFAVLAGLSTVWALIVGIWVARKAW